MIYVFLVSILAGLSAGLLGALCGVGGGIIMVPVFISFLGLEQKQAVATSLATILVIAAVSTVNNAKRSGLIDWKIVLCCGLAAMVASWLGAEWMHRLSNELLGRIFGVLLLGIGMKMLFFK